jgi:eukaryotic-like serine/threonine-protein kinase
VAEDGPRQVAGVTEGQILAGKYRVERVLGAGGMGVVVAAHHIGLDDKVAIKFLLPEMLSNTEAMSRFAREARNAVKIKGEHMARVFDVGTLETGAPYMVMEFLEGGDLHAWLRQRGPLPFEDAVDFVLQACEVIAEAHSLGIIHRDLKPANLFCVTRADGRVSIKVLDFGISKATGAGNSPGNLSMTATGALMGSPFYMSPEQMEGQEVDRRTDIWALGVIIQELITGKVPFPGATMPEVSIKVASRPPPPLRESRPDAPEGLQAVVSRCLEKDRERRYHNVAELAVAILPFGPKRAKASVERITDIIQAAGMTATAPSVPPSSEPVSPTETIAPFGGTASRTGGLQKTLRNKALRTFVVVGVLAAGGAVAVLRRPMTAPKTSNAGLASDSPPLAQQPRFVASAEATGQVCAPHSDRCDGTTPFECSAGQWVEGSVTAGLCGAICTPGATPAQCVGNTPRICASTGQWQSGTPCNPYNCQDGVCTLSTPPPSRVVSGRTPTTFASSHPRPEFSATPSPPAPPQTAPQQCDPPYYYDSHNNRVFKPECI